MTNITVLKTVAPIREHPFAFDPSYGLDAESALSVPSPQPPDDFEDFWKALFRRAREVDPKPVISDPVQTFANGTVHEIRYQSLDNQEIRGWLTMPLNEAPRQAFVIGHGYGGRGQPESVMSGASVCVYPCARGLGVSPVSGLETNRTSLHVLHGIESRDTYIHGGCVADYWCAANVLEHLFPEAVRQRLIYVGKSFGGGMGALLLPWDERFKAGALTVPSFGNHPLRVSLVSNGSNQYVRQRWLSDPAILDVLKYFDSASAAQFMKVPVFVDAALFDPSVPPPGQFSVFHSLRGPKKLVIRTAGHFSYPWEAEENAASAQHLETFLDAIDDFAPSATTPPISAGI